MYTPSSTYLYTTYLPLYYIKLGTRLVQVLYVCLALNLIKVLVIASTGIVWVQYSDKFSYVIVFAIREGFHVIERDIAFVLQRSIEISLFRKLTL